MIQRSVFAALSVILSAGVAHAGDVHLTWDGSRIGIGEISEDETTITPGVRVFDGLLGDPDPRTASDPGLLSMPGTFPVGSSVGLNVRSAVRKWDGSAFGATPSGDVFRIYLGAQQVTTPLTDVLTPGFSLPVDADGTWHHHPFWEIGAASSNGIYLAEIEVYNTATNLPSVPFWFVWNKEADPDNPVNDVEGARTWVNANLVPAPGAGGGVVLALIGGVGRRRRR